MPAFDSSIHTESFQPDAELGGEVHVMREDDDVVAGLYRFRVPVEPFPYAYEQNETIVILEGRVHIDLDGGESLDLGPGDMASVAAGSRATWRVETPFKEVFVLSASSSQVV